MISTSCGWEESDTKQMKHNITSLTLALVVSIGLAAQAASVTHTATLPDNTVLQGTADDRSVAVPQFNPTMGILKGVRVEYKVTVTDRFAVENVHPWQTVAGTQRAIWTCALKVEGTPQVSVTAVDACHQSVSFYDGVFNYEGTSGRVDPDQTVTRANSALVPLTPYIGTGNVTLQSVSSVSTSFTKDVTANPLVGGSPIPASLKKVRIEVTVLYSYDPI